MKVAITLPARLQSTIIYGWPRGSSNAIDEVAIAESNPFVPMARGASNDEPEVARMTMSRPKGGRSR